MGLAVGDIKDVQDQAQLESNLLQVCAACMSACMSACMCMYPSLFSSVCETPKFIVMCMVSAAPVVHNYISAATVYV